MYDKYDGIKIGMLLSEAFLNDGIFNSQAIGKAYDLKLRSDLTPQSSNVNNMGASDDTSVFEVVETYKQSIDTLLQNAKDPLNSGIATLDIEHYEIHEGDHFLYSGVMALGSGATGLYTIQVGVKPIHFVYSVAGNDAGISGNTYENVVANNDGTLLATPNNNRMSLTTSTMVLRLNPTGLNTTGSTLLREFRAGTGGTPATRVSGSVNRGNEVILKSNTKYSLSITNLATATNNVSVDMSWYEL